MKFVDVDETKVIKTNFPVRGRKPFENPFSLIRYLEDQNQLPRKGTETSFCFSSYSFANALRIKTNFPVRGRKHGRHER